MENLKSKEMVKLAVQALEDKKGEDITVSYTHLTLPTICSV